MKTTRCVLPAAVILFGSIVLLFARLGHYALWDDEAITAMTARAVWHTGDTSARVDDHNLLVYRNGLLVRNFKDRYTPPLQFYLFAPFIGLLGDSNFVCRLPVAICGLVTVCVMLMWLNRLRPPPFIWWAAAVVLLTNASFFLFFRQCRYYGIATMLTGLVAYLYCNRDGRFRWTAGLAIALSALLATQYLDYAAVIGCLLADYLVWGRKKPFTIRHWLIILLPQVIVGSVVLTIWNPLAQTSGSIYHSTTWISDRLCVLWWNWRDMIGCDFVIVPLLTACPLLYFKNRSIWMLRAPFALAVFVTTIALVEPISLAKAMNAEVRYLAPALVLCVGVGIVAVAGLQSFKPKVTWILLGISAGTLLVEPIPGGIPAVTGSTAIMYYHELALPQVESYTPVIDWVNSHVPAGASIYTQPAYKAYPLMLRAGKAIYAWQLDGDSVAFTADTPSPTRIGVEFSARQIVPILQVCLEMSTLTAKDASGNTIAVISVLHDFHPTPVSVASALIAAWNENPKTAAIAIATGDSAITLSAVQRGQILNVVPSVQTVMIGHPTIAMQGMLAETSINPPRPDFSDLQDVHFKGRIAPDYMIRFGTNGESADFPDALNNLAARGIRYKLVDTVHLNWKDLYRPERIWRSFTTADPKPGEEIYIYKKTATTSD